MKQGARREQFRRYLRKADHAIAGPRGPARSTEAAPSCRTPHGYTRHTAARPGKNLRAGSTRVSTHRCGGSCTTGCARCGWWTWPSLLRLGATSRRALRRGRAAMELREQRPSGFLLFQLPTETKKIRPTDFSAEINSPSLSPTKSYSAHTTSQPRLSRSLKRGRPGRDGAEL